MVENSKETLKELRYWLHSIHAHIYPPDDETRGKDEAMNRVLLVGTHRDDMKQEELETSFNKIDKLIEEEFINDNKHSVSINHIHSIPSLKLWFVPVENSIDCETYGEEYLVKSGIKDLQDMIVEMSEKPEELPFLHHDHPIKWLKFEENLKIFSKTKNVPFVKMEEINQIALQSEISEEDLPVALEFFHEAGKIIYLDCLPGLFLDEWDHSKLKDLVMLDPDWLMKFMKVVMELGPKCKVLGVKSNQTTGPLYEVEVLEKCWKKEFDYLPQETVELICIVLQAHCLIYPVVPNCVASYDESVLKKYMIPSKFQDDHLTPGFVESASTFHFDFHKFLPKEVYHKLVCLATSEAKPWEISRCNSYSRNCCTFYNLLDTNWEMELLELEHKLKIRVVVRENPIKCIKYIHDMLLAICQQSGWSGLQYCGGPPCRSGMCGEDVILPCAKYIPNPDGTPTVDLTDKPVCVECRTAHDDIFQGSNTDQSSSLGIDDLDVVKEQVIDLAACWEDLGLALGIKEPTLSTIETDAQGSRNRLTKVLSFWLKGNAKECSWKFLCEAVRGPLVKNTKLADEIKLAKCK